MKHRMNSEFRARSKDLFGNRYMLEICAQIAENPAKRVSLMSIRGDRDLSPSLYISPLSRLVRVGLLRDVGHEPHDHRTRWYEPAPAQLWAAADEIMRMSDGCADR